MPSNQMPDNEYFETAKARYIIDGKRYVVPMGHHWWVHIKYNQWPTPKDTYTNTTMFEAFALLPDFKPYSRETAALFDNRRGFGDVIEIQIKSTSQRTRTVADLLRDMEEFGRLVRLPKDLGMPEFDHFAEKPGRDAAEAQWKDIYVPSGVDGADFWFRCIKDVPSPACYMYDYRGNQSPYIEAVFATKHLSGWRDIRANIETLLTKFQEDQI